MTDYPIELSGDQDPQNLDLTFTDDPSSLPLIAEVEGDLELQFDENLGDISLTTDGEPENIDLFILGEAFRGPSAYEVAVRNGFVGTEAEWLLSLVGPESPNAAAAYAAQLAAEAARDAALAANMNATAAAESASGYANAAVISRGQAAAYADEAEQWATASLTQRVLAETASAAAEGFSITASEAAQNAEMARASASQIHGVVVGLETLTFGHAQAAATSRNEASVYADSALTRAQAAQASQINAEAYREEAGSYAAASLAARNAAESFATDSEARAQAAQTSRLAAEAALLSTNQRASAVFDQAIVIDARVNEAEEFASVAQSEKLLAETAAGAAQVSATNAATSELNAEGAYSLAQAQATLAANSALDANNSADAAVLSAQEASTHATNAGNSASAANISSVSAQSSWNAAGVAVSSVFPEGISGDWITNSIFGDPNTRPNAPGINQGILQDGVWTSPVGTNTQALYKAVVPWSLGKVYELQAEVQAVSAFNGSVTAYVYMCLLGSDYFAKATQPTEQYFMKELTVGERTVISRRFGFGVTPIGGTKVENTNNETQFIRFGALFNFGTAPNRQTKLYRMSVKDVTVLSNTEAQATAAALSASNASTSASDAGLSATAANTSATNAATSAGAANTSAGQASTSAQTADAHRASAQTHATNAANSALAAGNSATAAAGSSSSAGTHATNAANSASAAAASAVSAQSTFGATRLASASLMPERYVNGVVSTFTNSAAGDPSSLSILDSNATDGSFGPVRDFSLAAGQQLDWATVGVLPATAGKVYEFEAEFQRLSGVGGRVQLDVRCLDANFNTVGFPTATNVDLTGAVQKTTSRLSDVASSGIVAWPVGTVWLRPYLRNDAYGFGALVIRNRRLSSKDVTSSVAAANSASAAAQSASTAGTNANAAGNSASAANTSAVNASSAYVSAVMVGGNQEFEHGTEGWYYSGGATVTSKGGRANVWKGNSSANTLMGVKKFPFDPSRKYRVSIAYWTGAGPGPSQLYAGFSAYDASGNALAHNPGSYAYVAALGVQQPANAGWVEYSGLVVPQSPGIYGYPPGTASISLLVLPNYNLSTTDWGIDYVRLTDVTEQEAALSSANAAAISASTASTQAGLAGTRADAANTSATNASTSAGQALTYRNDASTAATNAAGSAAAASTSAGVAVSVGGNAINRNPVFSDWNVSLPPGWGQYDVGANGTLSKVAGLNGSPNAVRSASTGTANTGIYTAPTVIGGTPGGEWVVVEAEITLVAGNLTGAGVYFNWRSSGGSVGADLRSFATVKDASGVIRGAGVVGSTYRYRFLVDARGTDVNQYIMYGMTRYSSFAPVGAVTVDWHRLSFRAATPEEITTGTVLPDMQASINSTSAVALDAQGKVNAKVGVTLNANGKISGFSSTNNGTTSTFDVQADVFRLTDGATAVSPFTVSGGVVYAQNLVLRSAPTGARNEMDQNGARVYDSSGTLRVRWGVW